MYYNVADIKRAIERFEETKTIIKELKNQGIKEGQPFRVKQLNSEVTHSGATFRMLTRLNVLKIIERRKEIITLKNDYYCPKNYINENTQEVISRNIYKNLPYHMQRNFNVCEYGDREIETTYNVYILNNNWRELLLQELEVIEEAAKREIIYSSRVFTEKVVKLNDFFKNSSWNKYDLQ